MEDREQISGEFFAGTVNRFVENHEFSTVLFHQVLYCADAESTESIPMGNNKLELIAREKSVQ
jgi:hypothetical protein